MAKILLGWELGGDYGHLSRLLPVARELTARGHETIFVVRDLIGAEAVLAPHGFRWYQAPVWLGQVTNLPPPISYAELLMRVGFLNATALSSICRAWRELISLLALDLIILDHAPTALLATRDLGIPRINFGDGFCIPPQTTPLPPFSWWQRENMVRLRDSEDHALKTANTVLNHFGGAPLSSLSDLLYCEDALLCAFSELDHYPNRPHAKFLGPIFQLGQGIPPQWPVANVPRVFAYLKAGYGPLETALAALQALPAAVIAHVPGAARKTLAKFTAAHMVFSEMPLDMTQTSAEAELAVTHGGAGTTAAMLLAGTPLAVLPMQMEQTMSAYRLKQLGVATATPVDGIAQFGKTLKRALTDQGLRNAAERFAEAHAGYDQTATIKTAASRCEALLKSKS